MNQQPQNQMPPASEGTSLSLLARAQSREARAWTQLVELYAPLVYHWCRRAGLTPEDTADVFQEVFRSVAEHLGGFRRDRQGDTFRGWLRTIARNKITDHFRRRDQTAAAGGSDAQQRLLAAPDPVSSDDAEETSLVQQQLHRTLESIQGEFESSTWQAFWQVQVEGQAPSDVGLRLHMTPAAVRKAKYRVLQWLREELDDLLE